MQFGLVFNRNTNFLIAMIKSFLYFIVLFIIAISCTNNAAVEMHSIVDSNAVSSVFMRNMKWQYKVFKIENDCYLIDSIPNSFPKYLKFLQEVKYKSIDGQHQLTLKRINLSDVVFDYKNIVDDRIVFVLNDTMIFHANEKTKSLRDYISSEINCHEYRYFKRPFFAFIYLENLKADYCIIELSINKMRREIPTLYKESIFPINMHYREQLHYIIGDIGGAEFDFTRRDTLVESYQRTIRFNLHKFNEILTLALNDKKHYDIRTDTALLIAAIRSANDSVIELLYTKCDLKYTSRSDQVIQEIPVDKLSKYKGMILSNAKNYVISNQFEELSYNESFNNDYRCGDYYIWPSQKIVKFGKYYFIVMHDGGFQCISHIISIWELQKNKYVLHQILDKIIWESIGGISIDTVFRLDKQIVIIGTSSGGDGGDYWGSIWIAKWKEPRSLEILYRYQYDATIEDIVECNYRFLKNNKIVIKRFEDKDTSYYKKKFTPIITKEIISIDSLLTCPF